MLKSIITFGLILVAGYGLLCLAFFLFQEKLIFFPQKLSENYQFDLPAPNQEIWLGKSGDIHALYFQSSNPKGVILYFHGNAGSLAGWGYVAGGFLQFDYDILIVDYPTYGNSKGKLSEKSLYEMGSWGYQFLEKKYREKQIIIYGRSIGSGIATQVASVTAPRALILESPYYNLKDLARRYFPGFPYDLIMRYKFRSNKYVQKIECPIYIIHGNRDEVVPFESGRKLAQVVPDKTRFWAIEGGHHNDLNTFPEYFEVLELIFNPK